MLFYTVPQEKSKLFTPLVSDYLLRKDTLLPFISQWPDREGYNNQISERQKFPVNRILLKDRLQNQYEGMELHKAVQNNLNALTSENTFTITTGQQIHAFLGPMYVYWKIVSAIALAADLCKQFPEKHFVPVFWMATEDHDFEEVNHVDIFNKKITWENDPSYTGPVGLRSTDGLISNLEELDELFTRQEEWKQWSALFRKAYTDYKDFSTATRYLVNELFGSSGLLILDPNDAGLKKVFAPVIFEELKNKASAAAVEKTSKLLEKQYSRQLNPREINLFYYTGRSRERIEYKEGKYQTISGQELCTDASLENFVENNFSAVSANVVLRPVYQEMILPNLSYVGGPGEISYWLQLKEVFNLYHVPFPILENRKSIFVLGKKINEQLDKLGFSATDLFEEEKYLRDLAVQLSGKQLVSIDSEIADLLALKDRLINKTGSIQPSAVKPMADIFTQTEKVLRKIEKEIYNLQTNSVDALIEKLIKWKKMLKDEHFTQERNQFVIQYVFALNHAEILAYFSHNYSDIKPVSIIISN